MKKKNGKKRQLLTLAASSSSFFAASSVCNSSLACTSRSSLSFTCTPGERPKHRYCWGKARQTEKVLENGFQPAGGRGGGGGGAFAVHSCNPFFTGPLNRRRDTAWAPPATGLPPNISQRTHLFNNAHVLVNCMGREGNSPDPRCPRGNRS